MSEPNSITSPSANEFYTRLGSSLKLKFNKHFNQYQRKYLQRKMRCYEKGPSGASPASPQEYYPCVETVEEELKANSDRLATLFGGLDGEDQKCQSTCQSSFKEASKLNECLLKCFNKYSESAHTIYGQYYDQVLKGK